MLLFGSVRRAAVCCYESTFVWSFTSARLIVNKARTQNIHTHSDITIYGPMSTAVQLCVHVRVSGSFLCLHAKNQKDKGGGNGGGAQGCCAFSFACLYCTGIYAHGWEWVAKQLLRAHLSLWTGAIFLSLLAKLKGFPVWSFVFLIFHSAMRHSKKSIYGPIICSLISSNQYDAF